MSTSNYPTSNDDAVSLPNPTAGSNTNNPSHAALHTAENDAIRAVEAKLGTGASTPSANTLLRGTGTGTTSWGPITSAQLGSIVSDETGSGNLVFSNTPVLTTPKVDTINENTTNNGVTVDGLNIKDGVLNTNNSVQTSNIQTGAITTSTLADTAITAAKINWSDVGTRVTGIYSNYYTKPSSTGTTGNTYSFTATAPHALGTGEHVMIIATQETWCQLASASLSGTTVSYSINCIVSSSLLSVTLSFIYYI